MDKTLIARAVLIFIVFAQSVAWTVQSVYMHDWQGVWVFAVIAMLLYFEVKRG